jgi:hypothetical protein
MAFLVQVAHRDRPKARHPAVYGLGEAHMLARKDRTAGWDEDSNLELLATLPSFRGAFVRPDSASAGETSLVTCCGA